MSSPNAAAARAAGPHVKQHQCIEVRCTGCGEQLGEDVVLHFGSVGEALAEVARQSWEVTPDRVHCEDCVERRDGLRQSAVQVVRKCGFCWPPLFSDEPSPASCRCDDAAAAPTHVVAPFISRAHRGFIQHSCVTLLCGECSQPLGEDDDSIPHHPDLGAALAEAGAEYGWLITDAVVCCRQCARRRDCRATGHQFPEAPDYVTADCVEVRWCPHCGETVQNLAADPEQPWI